MLHSFSSSARFRTFLGGSFCWWVWVSFPSALLIPVCFLLLPRRGEDKQASHSTEVTHHVAFWGFACFKFHQKLDLCVVHGSAMGFSSDLSLSLSLSCFSQEGERSTDMWNYLQNVVDEWASACHWIDGIPVIHTADKPFGLFVSSRRMSSLWSLKNQQRGEEKKVGDGLKMLLLLRVTSRMAGVFGIASVRRSSDDRRKALYRWP
ncbi:hypothetical protein QBC47DRAFT_391308 [Echria macrotheca]|uniref:Uncharacterized protein n=1 Tax=Echria macrotheca TaxID=438768 RepID=A0AAJ0F230_9PEZI|nr:hypothetical protein QBC47DRAFT_391308 [Echria macrotheca]